MGNIRGISICEEWEAEEESIVLESQEDRHLLLFA